MTLLDARTHAENCAFPNFNLKKGHIQHSGERLKALTKECEWALDT